jgi:glycosyltransferase involved in cell wall biosynthesis
MDYSIIYFAFVSSSFGGVEQKIIAQFDALQAIHKNTHLFLVSSFSPGGKFKEEIEKRVNVNTLINTASKVKNPWLRRQEKFEMITNSLKKFDAAKSIVYFRFPGADYLFLCFLKTNKQYRFVTEHQEIENTFTKGKFNGNYRRNIFEYIWGGKVRELITGFVGVTPEITSFQMSYIRTLDKFYLTNGNGIDVKKYTVRQPLLDKPEEIKILFVGGGFKTHGLHRLLKSIAEYYKREDKQAHEVILKIAGDSHEMSFNKKLAVQLGIQQHVIFLGHCEGETLNKLFNWADVAVGSLGLHRIGLKHSSTLKAREYFSRGIPFFWSTKDKDLLDDNPYILKLEANENTFNMQDVIDFALKTREMHIHFIEMRTYAESNLDWSHKMENLKLFFDKIMGNIKPSR